MPASEPPPRRHARTPNISEAEGRALAAYVAHYADCQHGCRVAGGEPCVTGKHLIAKIQRFAAERGKPHDSQDNHKTC